MELIKNTALATADGYLVGGDFTPEPPGAYITSSSKASISGPYSGAFDVADQAQPGATYTVSLLSGSQYVEEGYETPADTTLSLRLGTDVIGTVSAYAPGNAPTNPITLTATVPDDYVFDGTNGINFLAETVLPSPWTNSPVLWIADPSLTTDYLPPAPEPEPVPEPVANVLAARAAAFIGKAGVARYEATAAAQLPIVAEFVRGYTRGRGFDDGEPAPPLQAVMVSAVSRLLTNPEQLIQYQTGDYSERPAILAGWTLTELGVLNRYRRRAA